MRPGVDLVVPVKVLRLAKSRLVGAADGGVGNPRTHAALALALAMDTLAAARATPCVRRVLAVSSDPAVTAALAADGVEVAPDDPGAGLNPALRYGARLLRRDDPSARVAALQADLPALRPDELEAAISSAGSQRAFCPDRQGTGTTLLVAAPGRELDPRFGVGSAAEHAASGAVRLEGPWPSLRCDVDTADDLAAAVALGLGQRTAAVLAAA
jgi:2-phospho-L-lactate guanylyltransferase